jgi:hypothetical protein
MSDGHGGYRAPQHPNAVSGPGKFSKRTDGGATQVMSTVPDQPYGAVKQQLASERSAPMAGQAPMAPAAQVAAQQQGQPAGPPPYQGGAFNAPSARPNEPITAGVDIGPGAGSEALSTIAQPTQQGTGAMSAMLQQLALVDTTGVIGKLLTSAQAHGV